MAKKTYEPQAMMEASRRARLFPSLDASVQQRAILRMGEPIEVNRGLCVDGQPCDFLFVRKQIRERKPQCC